MKKLMSVAGIVLVSVGFLMGCGASEDSRNIANGNTVSSVLQNRIENTQKQEKEDITDKADKVEESTPTEVTPAVEGVVEKAVPRYTSIDIDISAMSSDMVYAMVYQLMVNPEEYLGKVIRIKGIHQSNYYEPTGLTYHYAIIQDATACCAQGIEFEMAGGEAFPPEGVEVTVTGTFDVYEEEGYLYCTLRNAVTE